jgi:predicted Zn-dependent peptidase
LQEIIEKVEAVTRDDILELANDLFHPRQMALTLLGPVNNDKKEFEEILFDPDRS